MHIKYMFIMQHKARPLPVEFCTANAISDSLLGFMRGPVRRPCCLQHDFSVPLTVSDVTVPAAARRHHSRGTTATFDATRALAGHVGSGNEARHRISDGPELQAKVPGRLAPAGDILARAFGSVQACGTGNAVIENENPDETADIYCFAASALAPWPLSGALAVIKLVQVFELWQITGGASAHVKRRAEDAVMAAPQGKLAQDDIRLVALATIAEAPRRGYEIIKLIEETTADWYSPSPNIVYPMLTALAEEGYVSASADPPRLYTITADGRAYLDQNRALADAVLNRLTALGDRVNRWRRALGTDKQPEALDDSAESLVDILARAADNLHRR